MKKITLLAAFVAIVFTLVGPATVPAADPTGSEPKSPEAIASIYVVDLVATAAFGVAMNDAGDVTGTSYPDPGCGSACLPPLETVVWKGGQRIVLPELPGFAGVTTSGINNLGWVSGFGGFFGFGHAAAWKPNGNTYTPIDMGVLPGTTSSSTLGIDDTNRAVGCSGDCIPFEWTEAGGMVSLTTLGFPSEEPLGISPGGSVATCGFWYRLDDPGSVTAMPAPPPGWIRGCGSVAINDAGDQARFNSQTGDPEHLAYPFRFNHEGTWQQIGFAGTGHLSIAGVGSINGARDITATVQSAGMIAAGPDGLLQGLAALVSPAYAGSALTTVGTMNASGQILARMIIGQSGQRLVKLVPAQPCTNNCIQVTSIQMTGKGPPFCDQGHAQAQAALTVKNEAGVPLSGVRVTGHFFDDYWLDETVVGMTNANGQVTFKHVGPPCVGAIAFLVADAEAIQARTLSPTVAQRALRSTFDRTTGILTNYVIPLP